jgi:HEAT repeat protein
VERLVIAESDAAQRLERAGVAPEVLRDEALRALSAARGFVPPERARGRARRLLGQVLVQRADVFAARAGPGGAGVAHVALTIELASADGEAALRESAGAAEPLGDGPGAVPAALDRAARAAIGRAVGAFALEVEAQKKSTGQLTKDLASPDARVRDHAVRALADRGDRAAVPALIERLGDADPDVAERAVGALAQLHDARAVVPLIERTRHRDGPYVANLVRIVGDLGGPDARAWLVTLSSGHPDDVVRGAATEALSELAARESAPQAAAAPRAP